MNILFAYPHPDVVGGTEVTMNLWAKMLRDAGHKVFLAYGHPANPVSRSYYDDVVAAPALFDRNSKFLPTGFDDEYQKIEAFIRDKDVRVIHTHTYPRTDTLNRWCAQHSVVVNVHVPVCPNGMRYLWSDKKVCERTIGLGCFSYGYLQKQCGYLGNGQPIQLPGFLRAMWEDASLRRTIATAAQVVTNSTWMMNRLERDGIPSNRLRLLYPFETQEETDGDNFHLRDNPPALLFVGRMVSFKGPDHLLLASQHLDIPHQVWFVGDGPMRKVCEAKAAELGISDRVTFFGELTLEEVDTLRRRSTVAVVPSLWPEPFGRVGPEAMMRRRPVVAYNVGGVNEWLQQGKTGCLVPPGDYVTLANEIRMLLADDLLLRAKGDRAVQQCSSWTVEKHLAEIEAIYQDALQR
ncbi:MAG: hypothetical protein OHK0029_11180 [Armatimonadaceae bacterium]